MKLYSLPLIIGALISIPIGLLIGTTLRNCITITIIAITYITITELYLKWRKK